MTQNSSQNTTIDNPGQWSLFLRVAPSGFDALLYNPAPEIPMRGIRHSLPQQTDLLPALETFVYDNPLLLSDFGQVTILLETPRFALIPRSVETDQMRRDIMAHSIMDGISSDEEDNILTDTLSQTPLTITYLPDEKTLTFLRRTFHNPRIHHHLTPTVDYFASRRKEGNHARTFVQIRDTSLDIIIFRESSVALCNTFTFSNINDAAYFILASRQSVGDLDPDNDEIYICGEREMRLELGGRLERFVKNILPVIFPPSLFRKSRNVMDMPFDLILMPLCE